jgi:LmbE family N-acetylglucosaminyl deacetylase
MSPLMLSPADRPLRVLCLGAHADDIEIGCAGTLLSWRAQRPLQVRWLVACAEGPRGEEARRSARALLRGTPLELRLGAWPDTQLPWQAGLKDWLREAGAGFEPDVVLTHRLEDRHQDHRTLAEMSWQLWRDHLLLEYEIPKWEGDLGQPNVYVPLAPAVATRKQRHLMRHFGSQRSRDWFRESTFGGLMALRAVECRAPSGQAEAFHARKLVLGVRS